MKDKILALILCVIGLSATFYGMNQDHNVIFIIGLIFVIAGYLLIRKKIKAQIKKQKG